MKSQSWLLVLSVCIICFAPGCSGRAMLQQPVLIPAAAAPVVPAEPEPDYEPLYRELDDLVEKYFEGIDLITAGNEVAGEGLVVATADSLHQATVRCIDSPGCDSSRYLDSFQNLLTRQEISLKIQASRIVELESSAQEETEREPGTTPFSAPMPASGPPSSLLLGTDLREIITLNGPIRAALDDWLTWRRPQLMEAYLHYRYLRDQMLPAYEQAGLPEALLFAMMATESGGKVHSYSRAGAVGLLQFMGHTGRKYGLGTVNGLDMRLDPAAATRANASYLHDRFSELDGSLEKTLAAYNGGESRMLRLHRKYPNTSLWDSRIYYELPRETREYVPRVLAAALLFVQPEDYNLEFPAIDVSTETLSIQREISVGELTICTGQEGNEDGWFRTLRNLNPWIEPGKRLVPGTLIEVPVQLVELYENRCLSEESLANARELFDANYPDEPEMARYRVRKGDTLSRIASRFRCASLRQIAVLNGIRPPRYVVRTGQELKVPDCR